MAKQRLLAVLLSVLCCLLAVLGCLFLYQTDNKYTFDAPQGLNGALLLDEAALKAHPVLFLTDGWAYYPGSLLTPEDFAVNAPAPDAYIYIGQYGGFEAGDFSASPHGSASYRLAVGLPEEVRRYTLELPEIFSAYRLYGNGELLYEMGDPDPAAYRAETGNRSVTFAAAGRVELLFAVSDFSHLYSGMLYPPAFGEPDAVAALLSGRLLLRALVCSITVTIGLLSLLIGLLNKNRLTLLFSLLCLLFLGYAGYPLWLTVGSGSRLTYFTENLCFCALLLVVMLIQRGIAARDLGKRDWSVPFLTLGAVACTATVALHLSLPSASLPAMVAYSQLVMAYEWITAAWLTVSAAYALKSDDSRHPELLCGVLVFDCALMMDRLLPDYEPIFGGWFIELAAAVLVFSIGIAIGREVAAQYRANTVLQERAHSAERLLEVQKAYYVALQDQSEEIRTMQHNQRHHFLALEGLAKNRRYGELEAYLREYGSALPEDSTLWYCGNQIVNLFAHTYSRLAQQRNIRLELNLAVDDELFISAADLSALLGNLLENALEACGRIEGRQPGIRLSISRRGRMLAIHMENSAAAGRWSGGFLSSKRQGRRGYGLETVVAIAQKYGGMAEFHFDEELGLFVSTVMLCVC